jgi:hypothetical protein
MMGAEGAWVLGEATTDLRDTNEVNSGRFAIVPSFFEF